jgi:predicted AlkP superfamily phosphohydrolase/phosphomutase
MTGTNPGKHGIFDFVYRQPGDYRLRPATHRDVTQPSLWRLLSERARKVGVINVPMTYPPEAINGFLVSGLGTPNYKTFTYPQELSQDLLQDGYRVNRRMYYTSADPDGFLADTHELIASTTRAALKLMVEQPWDLFVVVYRDTDDVPHGFWRDMDATHPQHVPKSPYKDAILHLYQKLDAYLGQLVAAAGPETTVLLVSDHGFGPLYKEVFLNEWLRQKGYLVTKTVPESRRFLSRVGLTRENVSKILRKFGLGKLERLIKDAIGERIELLPKAQWPDFSEGIDWTQTRAYSFGWQGQIYLNLKGREPQGIVEPGEESEQLLDQIIADLSQWIDPEDNRPVVDQIYRREQLFHGPFSERAPDLTLVMRAMGYITRLGFELSNQPGEIFNATRMEISGGHRLDGVLIASGPAIAPSADHKKPAWLGDIAPTVLHILGEAVPRWMDGQVLVDWLTAPEQTRPVLYFDGNAADLLDKSEALTESEAAELMKRLSDLGYLG